MTPASLRSLFPRVFTRSLSLAKQGPERIRAMTNEERSSLAQCILTAGAHQCQAAIDVLDECGACVPCATCGESTRYLDSGMCRSCAELQCGWEKLLERPERARAWLEAAARKLT